MQPTATHVASSVVCLWVCRSVFWRHMANMTEPIDRPFWGLTRVGPRKLWTRCGSRSPTEKASWGVVLAHWKALRVCCSVCSKRDHSIYNRARHTMQHFAKILPPFVIIIIMIIIIIIVIRPHHLHAVQTMQPISTDGTCTKVCVLLRSHRCSAKRLN